MHLLRGRQAACIGADEARDAPQLIADAFRHPSNPREALRSTGVLLSNRIAGHVRAVEPDRRVRQMIKWASASLDGQVTLQKAAKVVGLSSGRASHLFVDEAGIPFRTYVLWLRLVRAVEAHSDGMSLTGAAQEAGFADSAHFSRTFKRMFGVPAAALAMS